MITTVTTVTTVALTSAAAASLTMLVSLVLIALLIQKEIIGSLESPWAERTLRRINLAIPPLLVVFLCAVAGRVYDVLR